MFAFAKPTAKILFFGVCPKGETAAISPYDVFQNDWEIYGSFALRYTFYPAIDLISSGAVRVRPIVSHVLPLGELPADMPGRASTRAREQDPRQAVRREAMENSAGGTRPVTLFDTIRRWADGQNALNAADPARAGAIQRAVEQALNRLFRHGSLADLAAAYLAGDDWWARLAEEHELSESDALVVRDAAHWQRFMQIRHPDWRADKVR